MALGEAQIYNSDQESKIETRTEVDAGVENISRAWENNVIKFPEKNWQDIADQDTKGKFKYDAKGVSSQVLNDLGFDNLSDAEQALESLNKEKDDAILSLTKRIKDRLFNSGESAKKYTVLESKIARLGKAITLAKATGQHEPSQANAPEFQSAEMPEQKVA